MFKHLKEELDFQGLIIIEDCVSASSSPPSSAATLQENAALMEAGLTPLASVGSYLASRSSLPHTQQQQGLAIGNSHSEPPSPRSGVGPRTVSATSLGSQASSIASIASLGADSFLLPNSGSSGGAQAQTNSNNNEQTLAKRGTSEPLPLGHDASSSSFQSGLYSPSRVRAASTEGHQRRPRTSSSSSGEAVASSVLPKQLQWFLREMLSGSKKASPHTQNKPFFLSAFFPPPACSTAPPSFFRLSACFQPTILSKTQIRETEETPPIKFLFYFLPITQMKLVLVSKRPLAELSHYQAQASAVKVPPLQGKDIARLLAHTHTHTHTH